jgi:hypothetical protein
MTSFADPGGMPQQADDTRDVQVNLNADVSGYTAQVTAAQQATMGLATGVDRLASSMGGLAKFAGRQLLHFSFGTGAAISGAVADAASLEKQLGTLRATTTVTGASMGEMKRQLDNAFSSFPVARSDLVQLMGTVTNLGVVAPKTVGIATSSYTKLGAAAGEDPNQLASGGLQLNRQMGNLDPSMIDKYNNALLTVSKNNGVAVSSVQDFSSAIAPMARAAGIGEAAVMGIATAFAKTGSDGALAANTFNSLLADMTKLSQTGSPDLVKYANFVGKGVEQFRGEGGTQQTTQLFDQLAKGDQRASNFLESQGYSTRALRTYTAIGQGGGLQPYISQAQDASHDSKNLDNASQAAFSGLTNSITMVMNEFTKLGEMIGQPFLGPLTDAVKAFGKLMETLNKIIAAMGPIPGWMAAFAGALALPIGLAVANMGRIATMSLIKGAVGKGSMPRVAHAAGVEAGQNIAAGMDADEAMLMTKSGTRVLNQEANLRTRIPYQMGMDRGAALAARAAYGGPVTPTPVQMARTGFGKAWAGTLGGARWIMGSQTDINREQGLVGDEKVANIPGAKPRLGGFIESVRTGTNMRGVAAEAGALVSSSVAAGASMTATAIGMTAKATATAAANTAAKAADAANAKIMGSGIGRFASKMGVPAPPPIQPAVAPVVAAGAQAVEKTAGLGARAMGAVGGFVSNPLVMIGSMIAIPLIGSLIQKSHDAEAKRLDTSTALSGATPYDQALDKTSTHLANFGDSLESAAKRLDQFANTPINQLGTVQPEDVTAVSNKDYKVTDAKLTSVVNQAKANAAAAEKKKPGSGAGIVEAAVGNYLDTQSAEGIPTGDRFVKMRQDVLASIGYDQAGSDQTSAIMTAFGQRDTLKKGAVLAPPDFKAIATLARTAGFAPGNIEEAKNIFGTGVSALKADTQDFKAPGAKANIMNLLSMGATFAGGKAEKLDLAAQRSREEAFGQDLQQSLKVDPKEWEKAKADAETKLGTRIYRQGLKVPRGASGAALVDSTYRNEADVQQVYAMAFANTTSGKSLMSSYGLTPQQLMAGIVNPGALPTTQNTTTTEQDLERTKGPLGQWTAGNKNIQAAVTGGDVGDPAAQYRAAQALADQATKQTSGNLVTAGKNLQVFSDNMGGISNPLGAISAQAVTLTQRVQDLKAATMSREGQFVMAQQGAQAGQEMINRGASGATLDLAKAKIAGGEDARETLRQTMIGQIQTVKGFITGQERQVQANTLQVGRSNRDFTLQQGYAAQDYGIQRGRSQFGFRRSQDRAALANTINIARSNEAFGIQQTQATEDYNIQRQRANEDYGVQRLRAEQNNNIQVLRAQQDFQLQSLRAQEDYQTNATRTTADHLRDLQRQAEDAAKTIYDPFARTQAKATTDAGTLVYNLQEQNADIARQTKELKRLKAQGISQQTIDTLNLGDASQAQEVDSLTTSIGLDPAKAKQINAQVATRATSTRALTQDPSLNQSFRRGEQDFSQQMTRSSEDFSKSQKRAAQDQSKTMKHMSEDFSRTQAQAAQDQAKTMSHMATDNEKTQKRAADAQALSLKHMGEDFALSQKQAKEDQDTTLANMDADFTKTRDHAVAAHKQALADMALDLKTAQHQAAEDLVTSLTQYTGGFGTVMTQLSDLALGGLKKYAPAATAIIIKAGAEIQAAFKALPPLPNFLKLTGSPTPGAPGTLGPNYGIPQTPHPAHVPNTPPPGHPNTGALAPGTGTLGPNYGLSQGSRPFAFGGISLTQQQAVVSEHGPELHLPLNSRGENFLTGLIAKSLAGGITQAIAGVPATAASTTHDNSISFAGAEIQVVAQDPNQMAKELAGKAKLARLASPVRH